MRPALRAVASREAMEVATQPLVLEKSIELLKELYEWLSNLPLADENDPRALNAAIEVLKLLRG